MELASYKNATKDSLLVSHLILSLRACWIHTLSTSASALQCDSAGIVGINWLHHVYGAYIYIYIY
jgi:hypothetical protein